MTFRRAYAACPDAGRKPLLTGVFPHAYGGREPEPLTRFFELTERIDRVDDRRGGRQRTRWMERGRRAAFPLSIRFPGKLEGGITTDVLISAVDVLPTVMALAVSKYPKKCMAGRCR